MPDVDNSIVLALSTACRHPAIAFTIATTDFPNEHFGGALLLYLLVNAFVGALYVVTCRRWVSGTKRLA